MDSWKTLEEVVEEQTIFVWVHTDKIKGILPPCIPAFDPVGSIEDVFLRLFDAREKIKKFYADTDSEIIVKNIRIENDGYAEDYDFRFCVERTLSKAEKELLLVKMKKQEEAKAKRKLTNEQRAAKRAEEKEIEERAELARLLAKYDTK